MRHGQGCQQRNYLCYWMILTLLAGSMLPGTTGLVSAEDPEPGKLLRGVGVNSDAGVTGSITINPAAPGVSEKKKVSAGEVLNAKFFTVSVALWEKLDLRTKSMKTVELEPQSASQSELMTSRATVRLPQVLSYVEKNCDVLNRKRVQELEQLIQSSPDCRVLTEPSVNIKNGQSISIPAPPELASEGGRLHVRYSRSYDVEHAGYLKFWITTPRYKITKTENTNGSDSDQRAAAPDFKSWRMEDTQLLKAGEKLLVEVAVLHPQSEKREIVLALLEVGTGNPRQVSQAKLQRVSSNSSGAKNVLNAGLNQETDHLKTVTYPVSDLVTPLPRSVNIARDLSIKSSERETPRFDPLVRLIEETISPELWDEPQSTGCTIRAFPQMQSLVIRARQATHDQIADCLEQLRTEQNQMVMINVRFITADDLQRWYDHWSSMESDVATELVTRLKKTDLTQGVIVDNAQAGLFKEAVMIDASRPLLGAIGRVFLHRQSTAFHFSEPTQSFWPECHFQLRPVIQTNGDVQVSMCVNPEQALDPLSHVKAGTIPPEHSLLVDVTDQMTGQAARLLPYSMQRQIPDAAGNQKRFLVLVTPSQPRHFTPTAFTPPSR